jgi:hypothetical protein
MHLIQLSQEVVVGDLLAWPKPDHVLPFSIQRASRNVGSPRSTYHIGHGGRWCTLAKSVLAPLQEYRAASLAASDLHTTTLERVAPTQAQQQLSSEGILEQSSFSADLRLVHCPPPLYLSLRGPIW